MNLPEIDSLNKAFQLAHFILGERGIALRITADALAKLEVAATAQDKRLYYTPAGRAAAEQERPQKLRTKVYMNESHLFQRLIYAESELHEKQQEQSSAARISEDDMVIRFIKHLVKITVKRNSFYVTLGLSRLLHSYTTAETMQIYGLVVQDPERVRDDYYYRSRKKQLMEELAQRFGSMLKTFRVNRGEERFQPMEGASSRIDLVAKCMSLFTPWDTSCVVPAKIDPTTDELPRLAFKGADPDQEHPIEVNRMHSVLHPQCFRRLIESFNYEPPERRLDIPRFFLSPADNSDGDQPPQDRGNHHELSEADLVALQSNLSRQAGRRRALSAGLLSISVDGDERARLDLRKTRSARFEVDEAAEFVEVHAHDRQGETLLAVLPLNSDSAPEQGIIRSDLTLEAGQKLSFTVSLNARDNIVSGAVVKVSYQETGLLRSAILAGRALLHRVGGLIASESTGGHRALKPALAAIFLAVTIGGIYVVSRLGGDVRQERASEQPPPEIPTLPGSGGTQQPSVQPPESGARPKETRREPVTIARGTGTDRRPGLAANTVRGAAAAPLIGTPLPDVKQIYIDPLGSDQAATGFRELLLQKLQAGGRLSVGGKRDDADAVFKGTVKIAQDKLEVVLNLVNGEGEIVWSTSQAGSGKRYRGQPEEVADRVVSALTIEMEKVERGSPARKPKGHR